MLSATAACPHPGRGVPISPVGFGQGEGGCVGSVPPAVLFRCFALLTLVPPGPAAVAVAREMVNKAKQRENGQ